MVMEIKHIFRIEHVGQTVYDIQRGKGKIISIEELVMDCPVNVNFDNGDNETYTIDGKCWTMAKNPSLSFVPWKLPEGWDKPPLPNLKMDDKVLVRDCVKRKYLHMHFKEWSPEGKIVCWTTGGTSWTSWRDHCVDEWNYWKLPEE